MQRLARLIGVASAAGLILVAGCGGGSGELVIQSPEETVVPAETATAAPTASAEAAPEPAATMGEVFLEPAGTVGPDPFTGEVFVAPVDLERAVGLAPQLRPASDAATEAAEVQGRSGEEPGLYGGTRDNATCDADRMLSFLQSEPAKATAWVDALNADPTLSWGEARTDLGTDDLPAYFDELTSVVLTVDTRVTNHGFRDGKATPRQSVLQAGSAVLVDKWGTPRVRCFCGNPLTPPQPTPAAPTYVGTAWPDFGTTIVVFVQPSVVVIDHFVLINVYTGDDLARPVGGRGSTDTAAVTSVSVTGPYPPTAGVEIDAPYDSASFTVFIDPARTDWVAFSGADQLVDEPHGPDERAPDGVVDIVFPDIDDYLVVTATVNGVSASTIIHDRDAMGTPIGEQSVVYGFFPSVWYVSHIDWSTTPPTSSTVTGPETGVLTEFMDSQGAGDYTFDVIYWNKWTDRVAHGPLYLLIGAGGGATALPPSTVQSTNRVFASPEDAVIDLLVSNGVPLDGPCGPDGAPGTYCWELYEERGFDQRVYFAAPQFFEGDTIWMLVGSGSAGWSVADAVVGGVGPPF